MVVYRSDTNSLLFILSPNKFRLNPRAEGSRIYLNTRGIRLKTIRMEYFLFTYLLYIMPLLSVPCGFSKSAGNFKNVANTAQSNARFLDCNRCKYYVSYDFFFSSKYAVIAYWRVTYTHIITNKSIRKPLKNPGTPGRSYASNETETKYHQPIVAYSEYQNKL